MKILRALNYLFLVASCLAIAMAVVMCRNGFGDRPLPGGCDFVFAALMLCLAVVAVLRFFYWRDEIGSWEQK